MKTVEKFPYYLALFRREFLQHNGALWVSPIVLMCIVQIGALFSVYLLLTQVGSFTTVTLDSESYKIANDIDSALNSDMFSKFNPIYGFVTFAVVLCIFYLLDSLYADRKDRSILFWRSLPVSEFENVAIKLFTSVIIIPGVFFIVGMIALLLAALIMYLGIQVAGIELQQSAKFIAYMSGLHSAARLFFVVIIFSVLLLPVHTALLVISAAARRSPWLTLILPLLGISMLELMVFHEFKVTAFIREYIEIAAQTSRSFVGGGDSPLTVVHALAVLVSSAAFFLICVFLRQRKFEI